MKKTLFAALGSLIFSACGPSSPTGGGCKDKMLPGDLVITEVFADYAAPEGGTSGMDEGREWFEIYNASGGPIELQGLTIVSSRPDGSKDHKHIVAEATIGPEQFFVLGSGDDTVGLPAYMNYGYGTDLGELFNTDGGLLTLKCGADEIDAAQYAAVKSGHSRELSKASPPDYTRNDDLAQWCQGNDDEFDPGNFGTPGQDNDCAPVVIGQCNDGGTMRDVVPPITGDLVISEVMPQPAGDNALQEWIELKVNADVDLNGLGVSRPSTTTGASTLDSADCIHVTAGSRVVLAKSADMAMNGGLPTGSVVGVFKSSLSLVQGSVSAPGDIQITMGTNVLDVVTWTKSTKPQSVSLDPDFEDVAANDDPAVFCPGTTVYDATSGNKGTPGMPNAQCASSTPPGMCDDGGTLRPIVHPAPGELVVNEALPNPMGATTANEFIEILNVGATAWDLNELVLQTSTSPTATKYPVIAGACVSIAPLGFGLLAHSVDPLTNGGLPAVDATFSTSLNLSQGVNVFAADGTTLIDLGAWSTGTATSTLSRQLKLTNTNATDNDTPGNYCNASAATQSFGTAGNFGTPKAPNVCP